MKIPNHFPFPRQFAPRFMLTMSSDKLTAAQEITPEELRTMDLYQKALYAQRLIKADVLARIRKHYRETKYSCTFVFRWGKYDYPETWFIAKPLYIFRIWVGTIVYSAHPLYEEYFIEPDNEDDEFCVLNRRNFNSDKLAKIMGDIGGVKSVKNL